jgi:hypothetical protein
MNKFDEREKAYENKFVHDAEIEFKINSKADKKLGLWAAAKMSMDEVSALDYAMKLVDANLGTAHDDDIVAKKIKEDIKVKSGLDIEVREIKEEWNKIKTDIRNEIMSQ